MAYNKDGPHSTLGPGHDGGFKNGFFAKPDGSDALHTHHTPAHVARGMEKQQTDNLGLARASRVGKRHVNVPVHWGHRSRTSPLPGMLTVNDVNGAPDAVQPNLRDPLTPSQAGKHLPTPKIHPSMIHREASACLNGEDVLREGIAAAGSDHPVTMAARLP